MVVGLPNSAGSFNRTCKYDAVNSVDDESLSMIRTDDNYSRTYSSE